jgi:hypothetical protein
MHVGQIAYFYDIYILVPVTLPKLIETEDRDYLRVALDPARVINSGYGDLLEKALNQISANAASLEA